MRLRAALVGSARVAPSELYYFDRASSAWVGPAIDRFEELWSDLAEPRAVERGLKRSLFPSTLWESGRAPVRELAALISGLGALRDIRVVVHTTYLTAAVPALRSRGARTLVDVYDLVWRAHSNDALHGRRGPRPARRLYAASVRRRELAELRSADALVLAGHADLESLGPGFPPATWIPTPSGGHPVAPRPAGDGRTLRVGILGHFAHEHTRRSAEALLDSPLALDERVEIVLAGLGSEQAIRPRAGVELLGAVASPEQFYERVDAVVAPVLGGSGFKTKLAEAILAGRPAVTTPLGAEGFSPALRRHLLVRAPGDLRLEDVREHLETWEGGTARRDFERSVGWEAVVTSYARAVSAL
jgi:hypothetical protein